MAGSSALRAAKTSSIITIRLVTYSAGDERLRIVNKPSQRSTTFSKCMKISMEKIETKAEARQSHISTVEGNASCQQTRWRAPNETPKRQISGQSLER